MHTKGFFQFIFAFLISSSLTQAQNYEGKIIDSYDEAVGFAHVFFKNDQKRGSSSNDNGEFVIYVSEANRSDTLVISVLGFKTQFISFSDIEDYDNIFKLESSALVLDEITIISDTYFRYILKEALAKIPDNYPTGNHMQKAYYQNYTISDTSYAEMIEADIRLIYNGYQHNKVKEEVYLNQLRKTEDNRNLPERLRSSKNSLLRTLGRNNVQRRSLSRFSGIKKVKDLKSLVSSVDDITTLQFYSQSMQDGDTIMTIKISDPVLRINPSNAPIFSLISINLTDKAIVKMVFGNRWTDKEDFEEVVYRKIYDKYYPAYIRNVSEYEFDRKTRKHYSAYTILFYDLVLGKTNIKALKRGKKLKSEKSLRDMKSKLNNDFWEDYPYANQLSATAVLRTKLHKYKQ